MLTKVFGVEAQVAVRGGQAQRGAHIGREDGLLFWELLRNQKSQVLGNQGGIKPLTSRAACTVLDMKIENIRICLDRISKYLKIYKQ